MNYNLIWKPLNHPDIMSGYLMSQYGDIRNISVDKSRSYKASYHSSNGYDYAIFMNKEMKPQLFPIDDIMAMTFITVPDELKGKRVKVIHINGDNRDISLDNLEWTEDVEIWRAVTYPGIKTGIYEVSNWGRARNIHTGLFIGFNRKGYTACQMITSNNRKHVYFEHRLVAYEFCVRNIDFDSANVNHIDGVKSHNRDKNLEIVTPATNNYHAFITGLNSGLYGLHGENHPRATIDESKVRIICQLIAKHKGHIKDIMNDINKIGLKVPVNIIESIKNKYAWVDISDEYFTKDEVKRHLSKDDVLKITRCILNHKHDKNIASIVVRELSEELPQLTVSKVNHILYKNSWKSLTDEYFMKGDFI